MLQKCITFPLIYFLCSSSYIIAKEEGCQGRWPVFQYELKGMEEVENEQVWSDNKVSCEEKSEEDVKEGEEDCKDNSSDVASGQDGCKDDASDESQTSDLGVCPDLAICQNGDYNKGIPYIIYSLIILKLYMT